MFALGYANEVGEAFRSLVHKSLVHSTYVVAFGYVLADGFSKSFQKVSVMHFGLTLFYCLLIPSV